MNTTVDLFVEHWLSNLTSTLKNDMVEQICFIIFIYQYWHPVLDKEETAGGYVSFFFKRETKLKRILS